MFYLLLLVLSIFEIFQSKKLKLVVKTQPPATTPAAAPTPVPVDCTAENTNHNRVECLRTKVVNTGNQIDVLKSAVDGIKTSSQNAKDRLETKIKNRNPSFIERKSQSDYDSNNDNTENSTDAEDLDIFSNDATKVHFKRLNVPTYRGDIGSYFNSLRKEIGAQRQKLESQLSRPLPDGLENYVTRKDGKPMPYIPRIALAVDENLENDRPFGLDID
jgi:hypothetical protein